MVLELEEVLQIISLQSPSFTNEETDLEHPNEDQSPDFPTLCNLCYIMRCNEYSD